MSISKKLLTGLSIIFCFSLCQAQVVQPTPAQAIEEHKKEIANTEFLFEGTVKQEKHYSGSTQAITTCIVQITKIFKGSPQLKLGTIKVVTSQDSPVVNGISSRSTSEGGDVIELRKGHTYIIFGRLAGESWCVDSTPTANSLTLTSVGMDYPVVITGTNQINWQFTPQLKTKNEVYSFFKENGITVQEEAQSTNH